LSNWQVYVLVIAGALGVLFQQIGLQTGRLAPTVATGSVTEPLLCVILGIVLLEERLSGPPWHKIVAFVGLGSHSPPRCSSRSPARKKHRRLQPPPRQQAWPRPSETRTASSGDD
jgi:hypothetical protein